MNEAPKILFLGNHTVGVRTLRVLARHAPVVGVVAHPADPEDGVRYESVFDEAFRLGLPVLRAPGRSAELAECVRRLAPDLLWIADYRYLLPADLLRLPRLGTVNLHPSLLPRYRGRAPVNWAILHGETQLGLTAHLVDEGADTGDILAQRAFTLTQAEDVGNALEKLYPLYESLTAEVLGRFRAGTLERRRQDPAGATQFSRRTPDDGLIDWHRPAREIWNLVRAVAAPYPGAFAPWGPGRVRVWQASGLRPFAAATRPLPGELVEISAGGRTITVACTDAALVINSFALEDGATLPVAAEAGVEGGAR